MALVALYVGTRIQFSRQILVETPGAMIVRNIACILEMWPTKWRTNTASQVAFTLIVCNFM